MRRKLVSHVRCNAWGGLLLLVCLGAAPSARAEDPVFVIRLAGGGMSLYFVSDVKEIYFEGDMLVVAKAAGSDRYTVQSITKIDFRFDPAGIRDPRNAAAVLKAVHLFQNQPNPFSPETRIAFELPEAGKAKLEIFSPDGRLVRTLVSGERPAGRQEVLWDGLNDAGRKVSSGVYFYNLSLPGVDESRRMILLP